LCNCKGRLRAQPCPIRGEAKISLLCLSLSYSLHNGYENFKVVSDRTHAQESLYKESIFDRLSSLFFPTTTITTININLPRNTSILF
jgi:hypothetical protein